MDVIILYIFLVPCTLSLCALCHYRLVMGNNLLVLGNFHLALRIFRSALRVFLLESGRNQ